MNLISTARQQLNIEHICGPLKKLFFYRDNGNLLEWNASINDGKFRALLWYRFAGGDNILGNHLKTASSRATYISKATENSLIKKEIQNIGFERVHATRTNSVIFDETTDTAGIEVYDMNIKMKFMNSCLHKLYITIRLTSQTNFGDQLIR